ncbi:MAG: hypothetical protein GKR88_14725 [Flavobacteriaceae bacterium]|nr:MAG: hypothetical protein GKR88_14725 [Flavobacteriaceae bacterium]
MSTVELRNKIIEQFNQFIQDDSKLLALDGVFDSLTTTDSQSLVSEEHYKIVEERRRKWQAGETKGRSWDEVKLQLKKKYGF